MAAGESEFDVTQATVSRDIKELRLVKTLSAGRQIPLFHRQENSETDMSCEISLAVCGFSAVG